MPVLPGFAQQIYLAILCQNLTLYNKFASSPTTGINLWTTDLRRHSPTAPQPAPSICLTIHC
ncbi:MAG: hypothetical protein IJ020_04055 [Bacteroidaceae bacterium]|nr:hypothetical protein [Bacteroidaceae bacterium]